MEGCSGAPVPRYETVTYVCGGPRFASLPQVLTMQGFVLVDLLLLVLSPLSDRGRAALLIVANCCNVYGGDSVYTVQEMLLQNC